MLPKGFYINAVSSGISKKKGKKDLGIIFSDSVCLVSAFFTKNRVQAAPVILSMKRVKSSKGRARAVVVNSGCANACTGNAGIRDAVIVSGEVSENLMVRKNEVLVASTGVIGEYLPVKKIRASIQKLSCILGRSEKEEENFARSIMTTDTTLKVASESIIINGKKANIWGCIKGSGMIHPDLKGLHATMLGFILTDVCISSRMLKKASETAVENSFNCVSVDGDTSTNDTVFILANLDAKNRIIDNDGKIFRLFSEALSRVCLDLAKKTAYDGEGAKHFIEVTVKNSATKKAAQRMASVIATSPLVKTAVFGCDANWGRILAAAGRSGVVFNPSKTDIYIGKTRVAKSGEKSEFNEKPLKKYLKQKNISITVDLKSGMEKCSYYTCDLSIDYVKINADYRT